MEQPWNFVVKRCITPSSIWSPFSSTKSNVLTVKMKWLKPESYLVSFVFDFKIDYCATTISSAYRTYCDKLDAGSFLSYSDWKFQSTNTQALLPISFLPKLILPFVSLTSNLYSHHFTIFSTTPLTSHIRSS